MGAVVMHAFNSECEFSPSQSKSNLSATLSCRYLAREDAILEYRGINKM
jgi:hypothetical protein